MGGETITRSVTETVGFAAVSPLVAAEAAKHGGPRMTASAVPLDGGPVEEFNLNCMMPMAGS